MVVFKTPRRASLRFLLSCIVKAWQSSNNDSLVELLIMIRDMPAEYVAARHFFCQALFMIMHKCFWLQLCYCTKLVKLVKIFKSKQVLVTNTCLLLKILTDVGMLEKMPGELRRKLQRKFPLCFSQWKHVLAPQDDFGMQKNLVDKHKQVVWRDPKGFLILTKFGGSYGLLKLDHF